MDEGVLVFGREILEASDLDPVYNYITEAEVEEDQLKRWLMAYSMFYHIGVANKLSLFSGMEFWGKVSEDLKTYPRGEERRHFRGEAAIGSVNWLRQFDPEHIVDFWYKDSTFSEVSRNVQTLPLYGPWIAFKLADMGERVMRKPISFDNCMLSIYKEPRIGASMVLTGNENTNISEEEISQVVTYITSNLSEYLAPPWQDRPLNVQEAETILCKYKSHKHGHYPIGKDIAAVRKALTWS